LITTEIRVPTTSRVIRATGLTALECAQLELAPTTVAWLAGGVAVIVLLAAAYSLTDRERAVATREPAATTANAPVQNPSAVGETTGSGISSTPNRPPATNR
jgi:hypothetical protein